MGNLNKALEYEYKLFFKDPYSHETQISRSLKNAEEALSQFLS